MFILVAEEVYCYDDPYESYNDYRLVAIFENETIAVRNRDMLNNLIKKIWKEAEEEGLDQVIPLPDHYWIPVREKDSKFDPDVKTEYTIKSVPVKLFL